MNCIVWYLMIILLLLVPYYLNLKVHALPDVLKIGGLFENGDDGIELAFRYAVDRVNADNRVLPNTRLIAQVERLERFDSFQASKRVCSLLNEGVAAVFGPQSVETSAHVQSTCDVLHMPHMETRWDFRFDPPSNHSVNLYPHPLTLGNAYKDLVKLKNWKNFAILYEENEALVRIQEVLKDAELREKKIVVRQFPIGGGEYRTTFKELHKIGMRNIILDVPREHIFTVLKHAQQVEMLSEYHNYFFTSLDLHTLDLEDFQYGGTNISGFSLVDQDWYEFHEVIRDWETGPFRFGGWKGGDVEQLARSMVQNFTTEVGLVYDAVRLFATALHDLDRSQAINIRSISCDSEEPWQYGNTVTNYMRMINIRGITGEVKFDDIGARTEFKLRLLELTREGLKHVGDWQQQTGIVYMSNYTKTTTEGVRQTLKNKTLVVTTIIGDPYIMLIEPQADKVGNDRYEGYCIDLIKEISNVLGFKFMINIVSDRKHGGKNERGEWNGLIRELIEGKADIAVADLTITYERESAVDFTMPFMSLGIGILYKKPKEDPPALFSFMFPLALDVWIYLMTSFLGVTLFLFFVARFSPYEWHNPHPCVKEPEELKNNFSMKNTLWFTIGCLMQQGCDVMPRALSTRVLAASWWFFILILVSSYTANLAAFLTVKRMSNPIESVDDLAKQTKIPYGTLQSGSTQAFFRNSNFTTYARMWSFMEGGIPSVFVETNVKGVERVKKGDYAYLMESTSIEYVIERECELFKVGSLLDSKGYGIATPPDSPYRAIFSDAILKLQESGTLHILKERWWSGKGKCPKDAQKTAIEAAELGVANVGGVFVVLAVGSGIAFTICIAEFIWKMKNIPRSERDHICVELLREIKYVICCYGNTRPIRKPLNADSGSQLMIPPGNGLPFMPLTGYRDTGKDVYS